MISATRAVRPSVQRAFSARTQASNVDWLGFLAVQTATGTHKNEAEASWLVAKGGTGTGLNTLWGTYLHTKAVDTGSLKERMKNFMNTGSQA